MAIEMGTANFINPKATMEILDGIGDYLIRWRISHIRELIGSLNINRKEDE
jgi:dihydroorotate dehydrogenase (NAD+) catalytic subunit